MDVDEADFRQLIARGGCRVRPYFESIAKDLPKLDHFIIFFDVREAVNWKVLFTALAVE